MAGKGPSVLRKRRGRTWLLAEGGFPYGSEYVIDASVAVKWYVDEEDGGREAFILRDKLAAKRIVLHAPELMMLEVANALRYSRRTTSEKAESQVRNLFILGLQMHDISQSTLISANALAWSRNITIYDALYAALAAELRVPLVTADGALLRRLEGTGLAIPLTGFK